METGCPFPVPLCLGCLQSLTGSRPGGGRSFFPLWFFMAACAPAQETFVRRMVRDQVPNARWGSQVMIEGKAIMMPTPIIWRMTKGMIPR